jgi:hypothetical protein
MLLPFVSAHSYSPLQRRAAESITTMMMKPHVAVDSYAVATQEATVCVIKPISPKVCPSVRFLSETDFCFSYTYINRVFVEGAKEGPIANGWRLRGCYGHCRTCFSSWLDPAIPKLGQSPDPGQAEILSSGKTATSAVRNPDGLNFIGECLSRGIGLFFCGRGISYFHPESRRRRTAKMASIYKLVGSLSWWLGVLCMIVGFLMKLVRPSGIQVFGIVVPHSLLFFAEILFLCTLATWAMERRDARP